MFACGEDESGCLARDTPPPMEDDLEVIREATRRFAAGELDGLADLYAPDAVMFGPKEWPETGRFDGIDAIVRQYSRLQEDWAEQSMSMERTQRVGRWHVVEFHWVVHGRASGAKMDTRLSSITRVEDGRIVELRFYGSFEEALAEAGLND